MKLSRASIRRVLASLAAVAPRGRTGGMDARTLSIRAGEFFLLPDLASAVGERGWPCPLGPDAPGAAAGQGGGILEEQGLDGLAHAVESLWTGERVAFQTSGSTGEPRRRLTQTFWLEQEALFLAGLFAGRARVVGLVPPHHIYGFLFAVLLPEALDVPVLDMEPHLPAAVHARLAPGDLVIGFPLVWKALAQSGGAYPPDVLGVTSTGPCPAEVVDAAMAAGLSGMTEIHGATETGGLGWRRSPREPYRLMDHWAPPDASGMLERMHPGGLPPVRFAPPDGFGMAGERLYRPSGRKDKAVQVAGVNVYPERVRAALLSHPLVAEAAVRLMRRDEGDRLKAFIVPSRDVEPSEAARDVRAHLSAVLCAPETPRSFTFGPKLPTSALGKDADWNAAAMERDDHD